MQWIDGKWSKNRQNKRQKLTAKPQKKSVKAGEVEFDPKSGTRFGCFQK